MLLIQSSIMRNASEKGNSAILMDYSSFETFGGVKVLEVNLSILFSVWKTHKKELGVQ